MVKQIYDTLTDYMNEKAKLDQKKADTLARWKRDLSAAKIMEIQPEFEAGHLAEENKLREKSLALIEKELSKVDKWVNYLLNSINLKNLEEIKALEGIRLTAYQEGILRNRYAGGYYATAALCEMLNRDKPEAYRLEYLNPEAFLDNAEVVLSEAIFVLANYAADAGQAAAQIKIQLIMSRFMDHIDEFTDENYFSEPDFDKIPPLTDTEKRMLENEFIGCASSYDRVGKADELTKRGLADLIQRSEYAKFLKDYHEELAVSPAGKRLLYGNGTMPTEPEDAEEDKVMDLSHLTGMGGQNH